MSPDQIEFAHYLDRHSYFAWLFAFGILFWFLAFAGLVRVKRPELAAEHASAYVMAALGILGFFATIGSLFLGQGFIERAGLAEVRSRLLSPVAAVTVDGRPARDVVGLLAALRQTHHVAAHHSSPLAKHRVIIQTSRGQLILDVARDSTSSREFWVFNPNFSENIESGRTYVDNLSDIPSP